MPERHVIRGTRIVAALALLLAIIHAPVRPTGASHHCIASHFLPCGSTALKIGAGVPDIVSASAAFTSTKAVPNDYEDEFDAEIEDELTFAYPIAIQSFDMLPSPCPEFALELVRLVVDLSAHPLRC